MGGGKICSVFLTWEGFWRAWVGRADFWESRPVLMEQLCGCLRFPVAAATLARWRGRFSAVSVERYPVEGLDRRRDLSGRNGRERDGNERGDGSGGAFSTERGRTSGYPDGE